MSARLRSRSHRWASLLAAEREGQAWMQQNREPLRRALAEIAFDYLLAAHLLRHLLIRYYL